MASTLLERDMYGNKYHMTHNPLARGRAPRYVVVNAEDGEKTKPKGVTSILGQTLAKDLMDWAVSCTIDYLRLKLPVVTEEDLVVSADEYKVKRDAGGSTGSEAHALVENYLKGQPTSGGTPEALNAFGAFKKWFESTKPEVINVEEVVYSKAFQYAGTYDGMLRIDGKVYLTDLKTTNASRKAPNGVYPENFLQLGAYALAHDEQREYEEKHGGTELLPIEGLMVISAKKDGKLDIVTNEDIGVSLEDCKDMFRRVINLYNFLAYTTKALGGK